MTDTIRHRGPDDSGYYRDPWASLGFRRLAIIDVAGGHQPMANEDASHFIIFNGEIFNHADLRPALEQAGLPGAATAGIGAAVTGALAADAAHDHVVLVIDQFEELLVLGEGNSGRFQSATGLISSVFTLSGSGEFSEYHCGLIFVND